MDRYYIIKNEKNIIKLIKILCTKKFYSKKDISDKLNLKVKKINKLFSIIKNLGIKINTTNNTYYKIRKKINFLQYKKIKKIKYTGKIIIKQIITSTNQYIINSNHKFNTGDICTAECQTHGRGKYGNYWISPFGCNIYLSIYWILKNHINAYGISLAVGVIIAETLNKISKHNIKVKWPNDIYINNKKIAGILVEIIKRNQNSTHMVIGIGLNISMNQKNRKWGNLITHNPHIERNKIFSNIILSLKKELTNYEKYGFQQFMERWKKIDNFINKKIQLCINNNIEYGIIRGVNEYGAILLEQKGKLNPFYKGKIRNNYIFK